jgi:hypothetical protein
MNKLNELIDKQVNDIKASGCKLSEQTIRQQFETVVSFAKLEESFEINQRYRDSIGTAFGHGGNDQVNTIGQHITEPEFIQPNDMVKGNWYVGTIALDSNWIFKFTEIAENRVFTSLSVSLDNLTYYNHVGALCLLEQMYQLRPATIEEVTKYFPNEFESENQYVGKWFRCINGDNRWFINGNYYLCVKNPNETAAFVDEYGDAHGFYPYNDQKFDISNPLTKEQFVALYPTEPDTIN